MTKQSKSGEAENKQKDKLHSSRNLEDHIEQQFTTTDGKDGWLGQELQVNSDPLIDLQTGDNVLLRVFDFGANPENLKRDKPTKQQLFDSHVKQIMTMLWSDGLEPAKEINPLIQISKKKEKYRILMWCRAKSGVAWADTPQSLQEITKNNAT